MKNNSPMIDIPLRSGGTQIFYVGNVKRFPGCITSEDCIQEQGTDKNYRNNIHLMHATNFRSAAVTLASVAHANPDDRRARRRQNKIIDLSATMRLRQRGPFFVSFFGQAKKEREEERLPPVITIQQKTRLLNQFSRHLTKRRFQKNGIQFLTPRDSVLSCSPR